MNTLASRLSFLLKEKKLSQDELAKKINITQGAIGKILRGQTKNPKYILELADVLNVDPTWLKTGKGDTPDFLINDVVTTSIDNINIPVLDIEASAGLGSIISSDLVEQVSLIEYQRDYFTRVFNMQNAANIKLINVKGDSMAPTLESGDLVFVNTSINTYDGDGVYIFSYGENLYIKRLQMAGTELLVISDNKLYKDWSISENNENNFKICAKVILSQSQKFNRYG